MMPLSMAKAGETVTIHKITGKDEVRQHLAELGFVGDADVTVAKLHGEGPVKRRIMDMGNAKWTAAAIGYMCVFAYAVSPMVFQPSGLVTGEAAFGIGAVAVLLLLAGIVYLLVRKDGRKPGSVPACRRARRPRPLRRLPLNCACQRHLFQTWKGPGEQAAPGLFRISSHGGGTGPPGGAFRQSPAP